MTDRKIKLLLFLTVLVATIVPMSAALYFLDDALQTSLDLGFNPSIVRTLESGSENLRRLRDLDPENAAHYRAQFEEIQELRHVYSDPQLIRTSVLGSLKTYFALGLAAAVLLSLAVSMLLSRRIAAAYRSTFDELIRQREKVRYLEELGTWQELARMLAHEIKNPLTPIEVLVGSLSRAHETRTAAEFREQLSQAQAMIGEELRQLKSLVNKFAAFSKLPEVQLVERDMRELLDEQTNALALSLDDADIQLDVASTNPLHVRVDATLFRQVLSNIVRNGVEANPGRRVRFRVSADGHGSIVRVTIENDGEPVARELVTRLFDPYFSTRSSDENMGLGLAIVRKIVIEHGGDVSYEERQGHPAFVIQLPLVAA